MSTDQRKAPHTKPRFRVGEWVAYPTGLSRHVAEVIEYCGRVGTSGRHYYRLREPIWYGDPVEYELPETSLEHATMEDLDKRFPPDQRPVDVYTAPDPYTD